jgi:hypothetical protein
MKNINLGQAIQILANVGVIAGIVMLAIELRQNNELLDVELRTNANDRVQGTADIVLENPYLLELLGKDPAALAQAERDAVVLLGIRSLTGFESSYRDVVAGVGDEEQLRRAVRAVWDRPRLNYGVPLAWDTFKDRTRPEFRAWMEANVINRETSAGDTEGALQ